MTTPNRPERESDESWEPGRDISESSNDPARLTGGAWLSLALSLAFFLSMVAIGMKYGVARHPRDKPAEAASTVLANAVASVPAPVVEAASMPTTPADDVNTLLARAHECASTAQWDCVIEATSGVIAQRGNTPETKALLAQAMVKGGWVPGNTPAPAIKVGS